MKIIAFLLLWVSASAGLPHQFSVVERLVSLTSTFDAISEEEELFVTARKQLFSLTPTFELFDNKEELLATACCRFFSWGTDVDVVDAAGKKIGRIEEELVRFFPWAEYRLFDAQDRLVAIAKMDSWGIEFNLCHPEDETLTYATINRSFFRLYRDDWAVQIQNVPFFEEKIDPLLLVVFAIIQTDKDHRDQSRQDLLKQINPSY